MNKFSDYISSENKKKIKDGNEDLNSLRSSNEKTSFENKKQNQDNYEDLEDLIDKYSKLGSDDLMKKFLEMTIAKKKKGELNEENLSALKNTIAPYLTDEQKVSLNNILDIVKNV